MAVSLPAQVLTSDSVARYRQSINGLSAWIPGVLSSVDMVALVPYPAFGVYPANPDTGAFFTPPVGAAAVLCYLPHRVVSATRIRWRYTQGGTAQTGDYVLAVYNAAGSKVSDTGTVALTGAANSVQVRAETISAATFEAGPYYVFFAFSAPGFGTLAFPNVETMHSPVPNVGMFNAFGTTAPAAITSMTDQVASSSSGLVPVVALSVG